MSNDPDDSSNRRDTTLAFVLHSLQEHERNLDNLIDKLADISPQFDHIKELYARFEKVEAQVEKLEKEIKNLIYYFTIYKQ
jgi:peptidoglycan hydrolase CwlO-like protein